MVVSLSSHFDLFNEAVEIITVDDGFQRVDMVIVNKVKPGDIVVTGDYGLAALVLGKGCYAISPRGRIFTVDKIDNLLMIRHLNTKILKGGGRIKGPPKIKRACKKKFEHNLIKLIKRIKTSSPQT